MGSAYASRISKVTRPSVGLLNIGEEAYKGDELLRTAHALLANAKGLSFRGNVEGKDVPLGAVDVVVCPGVIGNVVLKLLESMGDVLMAMGDAVYRERLRWRAGRFLLRDGLARVSNLLDYASYGGAPILGFERIVIKAHGRSRERALENAVKVAAKAVRDDVCGAIAARAGGERKVKRYVLLDRDGTLIRDVGHPHRLADYALLEGVAPALHRLADAGYRLAIVTNQSGIGRGYFGYAEFQALSRAPARRPLSRGRRDRRHLPVSAHARRPMRVPQAGAGPVVARARRAGRGSRGELADRRLRARHRSRMARGLPRRSAGRRRGAACRAPTR